MQAQYPTAPASTSDRSDTIYVGVVGRGPGSQAGTAGLRASASLKPQLTLTLTDLAGSYRQRIGHTDWGSRAVCRCVT